MNYIKTPNSQQLPAPPEDAPDPVKELAHEWLDVMQSDPDYLEEALGDFPEILGEVCHLLHKQACNMTDEVERLIILLELNEHVLNSLSMYADAKAESGEQLP